ncbi:MAG: VOC family protein, partial [Thermoplasmata archaeon]
VYLRVATYGEIEPDELPTPRAVRDFLDHLETTGRLLAAGPLTHPGGHFLLLRATDLGEARRAIRRDPFAGLARTRCEIWEWDPERAAAGVNLEPAPAHGSGRLTQLQRISVFVRDREKAKAWYRDVLGLTVRVDERPNGRLEMSLGPGAVALSISVPERSWGERSYTDAASRIGRATGLVFQTDSVRALALRLEHGHAQITSGPYPEPWGEWTVRFTDPDGNEYLAFGPEGRRQPKKP